MGDKQGGGLAFKPYALKLNVHLAAQYLVECAERLVEKQNARIGDQRAGNCHTLAHAAGKLTRKCFLEAFEANKGDQFGNPVGLC